MIKIFLRGMLLGLGMSITIGPAFLSIIQTGIQRGVKYGISMALGVALSDIILIAICLLGLSSVINNPEYKLYIGVGGGMILIVYGIYSFFSRPRDPYQQNAISEKKHTNFLKKYMGPDAAWFIYTIKGFFLNFLNPFLLIFWLTAVSMVGATASENELRQSIIFFSGTISVTFMLDILKSYLGEKIKKMINYKKILIFNKMIGVLMIIFGIALIAKLFI